MDALEGDLNRYTLQEYGDFLVGRQDWDRASERQGERSPMAQRVDGRRRAPVTTNFQVWASDPSHYDYPAIDTPRAAPHVLPKDHKTGMRVRTTDSPEHGSDPPASPLGGESIAEEHFRGRLAALDVPLSPEEAKHGAHGGSKRMRGGFKAGHGEYEPLDFVEGRDDPPGAAMERHAAEVHERGGATESGVLQTRRGDDGSLIFTRE